jgi:hypothetical protein
LPYLAPMSRAKARVVELAAEAGLPPEDAMKRLIEAGIPLKRPTDASDGEQGARRVGKNSEAPTAQAMPGVLEREHETRPPDVARKAQQQEAVGSVRRTAHEGLAGRVAPLARHGQRTGFPLGRTTSQRPPNSSTFWQRIWPGLRSPT